MCHAQEGAPARAHVRARGVRARPGGGRALLQAGVSRVYQLRELSYKRVVPRHSIRAQGYHAGARFASQPPSSRSGVARQTNPFASLNIKLPIYAVVFTLKQATCPKSVTGMGSSGAVPGVHAHAACVHMRVRRLRVTNPRSPAQREAHFIKPWNSRAWGIVIRGMFVFTARVAAAAP